MKSVLISIQPKWCELISSGKKTVEVRKTKPKFETPFKVYIYETNWRDNTYWKNHHKGRLGKVIGEFVCDRIRCEKEVADGLVDIVLESTSCVGARELLEYANGNVLYSWHISDLVIYDKPRELSEFRTPCKMTEGSCYFCDYAVHGMDGDLIGCNTSLTRPPQSWCYVEDLQ